MEGGKQKTDIELEDEETDEDEEDEDEDEMEEEDEDFGGREFVSDDSGDEFEGLSDLEDFEEAQVGFALRVWFAHSYPLSLFFRMTTRMRIRRRKMMTNEMTARTKATRMKRRSRTEQVSRVWVSGKQPRNRNDRELAKNQKPNHVRFSFITRPSYP